MVTPSASIIALAAAAAIRLCENLPYIGSILREFEIIPYYGHTYA
jgi:hypothetical protein